MCIMLSVAYFGLRIEFRLYKLDFLNNTINELWDQRRGNAFYCSRIISSLNTLERIAKKGSGIPRYSSIDQELVMLEQKIGNVAQILLLTKELEEVKLT